MKSPKRFTSIAALLSLLLAANTLTAKPKHRPTPSSAQNFFSFDGEDPLSSFFPFFGGPLRSPFGAMFASAQTLELSMVQSDEKIQFSMNLPASLELRVACNDTCKNLLVSIQERTSDTSSTPSNHSDEVIERSVELSGSGTAQPTQQRLQKTISLPVHAQTLAIEVTHLEQADGSHAYTIVIPLNQQEGLLRDIEIKQKR